MTRMRLIKQIESSNKLSCQPSPDMKQPPILSWMYFSNEIHLFCWKHVILITFWFLCVWILNTKVLEKEFNLFPLCLNGFQKIDTNIAIFPKLCGWYCYRYRLALWNILFLTEVKYCRGFFSSVSEELYFIISKIVEITNFCKKYIVGGWLTI